MISAARFVVRHTSLADGPSEKKQADLMSRIGAGSPSSRVSWRDLIDNAPLAQLPLVFCPADRDGMFGERVELEDVQRT